MIKIYIACLSSYNNGFLFGKWFDLDNYSDEEDLLEDIQKEVLDNPENPSRKKYGENPEEWAMHDIEGIDYGKIRTEYPDLSKLIELNELLSEEHGEIILDLKDHLGLNSIEDAKEYHEDNHIGKFANENDMADYVAEHLNGWDLSSGIGRYFDSEAYARDLTCGDIFNIDDHYYWSR